MFPTRNPAFPQVPMLVVLERGEYGQKLELYPVYCWLSKQSLQSDLDLLFQTALSGTAGIPRRVCISLWGAFLATFNSYLVGFPDSWPQQWLRAQWKPHCWCANPFRICTKIKPEFCAFLIRIKTISPDFIKIMHTTHLKELMAHKKMCSLVHK